MTTNNKIYVHLYKPISYYKTNIHRQIAFCAYLFHAKNLVNG